jgi:hypothetical protein
MAVLELAHTRTVQIQSASFGNGFMSQDAK